MIYCKQKLKNAKVKIREKLNPVFAPFRRKKLIADDFTIISNNCWGGMCIGISDFHIVLRLLDVIFMRRIISNFVKI